MLAMLAHDNLTGAWPDLELDRTSAIGSHQRRAASFEPRNHWRGWHPPSIAIARRDHGKPRLHVAQKFRGRGGVATMMGHDQHIGLQSIRVALEKRPLRPAFHIASEEQLPAVAGNAQNA